MPDWWGQLWPVAAFFLGVASNFFLGALGARWQWKRETNARKEEHDMMLRERRETFELETLGHLSPKLRDLGRLDLRVDLGKR